jgi:predicted cupin superfamily sugar epimerase
MELKKITPQQLVEKLKLLPHPEGGWYRETYRSSDSFAGNNLPLGFEGVRSFSTAIYFLLEKGNFSAFHRIKSDECWHFYSGQSLDIFIIHPNGIFETISLGPEIEREEQFQFVVPANTWFASRPSEKSEYCLVGCTVAPGFDFNDFELANADALCKEFPQHEQIIKSLCRS